MTTDDLLKAICGNGSREICQNPWTVRADDFTWSAATDGMRALFISDASSPYPADPQPAALAKMLGTGVTHHPNAPEIDRAELLAEIGEGVPVDWGSPCHECDGSGSEKCDLGYEHDCKACGGVGSANGPNSYTWQRAAPLSITIGDRCEIIDTQLLRGVIANLPGDPIRVGLSKGRCVFFSDGWILILASMTAWQLGEKIRSIKARPSALGGTHGER